MNITANLIVDSIPANLEFWVKRLGFTVLFEVPHEGEVGFVMITKDGAELMLQSRASLGADIPPIAKDAFKSCLYIKVKDLKPIRAAVADLARILPDRKTFYGADEVLVKDPSGNTVIFAHSEEQK